MERRTFVLGMGSILIGACAAKPQVQAGSNPYAVSTGSGTPASGPTPPPPPSNHRHVVIARQQPAVCAPTPRGGCHYMTQRGDTLESIAATHRVPARTICEANPGRVGPGAVPAGRMLWLPGGTPVVCAPVARDNRVVASTGEAPVRTPRAPRGGAYKLVARADWGAQSLKPNHDPMNGVRRITLHHTDEVPGITARGDREIVSAIQRYHRNTLGWADIGYHYLIGRDGMVYEGRAASAQGAHSGGANNIQNLGIAVIGNFSHRMPSAAQMRALESFLSDQKRVYRVPNTKVYGHRDLGPTECPGTTLYSWLTQHRA